MIENSTFSLTIEEYEYVWKVKSLIAVAKKENIISWTIPESFLLEWSWEEENVDKFYKGILVKEHERALKRENFYNTDVIFSVGYMKVIDKSIIENFDVINLHPSILPNYKGLMTQKRMLINNEKYYGFTIHKVSPELDDGKIISNKTRKIKTKNESELLKKHKSLEHQFVYKQLVNYLLN